MQDPTSYRQLQPEDRMTIARMLQRAPSTVGGELERNTPAGSCYGSHVAQTTCQARQRAARPAAKLDVRGVAWRVVLTLLN